MDMETEILRQILSELKELRQGQTKLEQGQARMQKDIDFIKTELRYAFEDANSAHKLIHQHEYEYHGVPKPV